MHLIRRCGARLVPENALGDKVNIEIDPQTQAVVDAVERAGGKEAAQARKNNKNPVEMYFCGKDFKWQLRAGHIQHRARRRPARAE